MSVFPELALAEPVSAASDSPNERVPLEIADHEDVQAGSDDTP
jgi:hypothetical protein